MRLSNYLRNREQSDFKYNVVLNLRIKDDDIIERKTFNNRIMRDFKNMHEKLVFLNTIFENPNKYFVEPTTANTNCFTDFDDNLFLRRYSENMNIDYNCTNANTTTAIATAITNTDNHKYNVSGCEYHKESQCYNNVIVGLYGSRLAQYKVLNHDKFASIVMINNLLFKVINTYMNNMSNDCTKLQNLIAMFNA